MLFYTFEATWYDGIEAVSKPVTVTLNQYALTICDDINKASIAWRYDDIIVVNKIAADSLAQFTNKTIFGTRLLVKSQSDYEKIYRAIPKKHATIRAMTLGLKITGSILLILLAFFVAVPSIINLIIGNLSLSTEETLGESYSHYFTQDVKICKDPDAERALNKLLFILKDKVASLRSYHIMILKDKEKNAFSLPGGYIFLLSGALSSMKTQQELVGVLAHEMGHIENRHGLARAIRSMLMEPIYGDNKLVTGLFLNRYSREQEQEADGWAIKLLDAVNIDPTGLSDFLERDNEAKLGGKYAEMAMNYFATHPATSDRIAMIKKNQKDQPYMQLLTSDEWHAIKRMCD